MQSEGQDPVGAGGEGDSDMKVTGMLVADFGLTWGVQDGKPITP